MLSDLETRMLAALKEMVEKADRAARAEAHEAAMHSWEPGTPRPDVSQVQAKDLSHIRELIAEAEGRKS